MEIAAQARLEIWSWIDFLCEDAQNTMDRDRKLFEEVKAKKSSPILRFYSWKEPTLSYGRTQGIDPISSARFLQKGWQLVKRPTGGGKVFHKEDLCFSLIWKKTDSAFPWGINESYCAIHQWIQKSLKQSGVETHITQNEIVPSTQNDNGWCFESPVKNDLLRNGQKIVGGAQWRDGNVALHQGSIQTNIQKENIVLFKKCFESYFNTECTKNC